MSRPTPAPPSGFLSLSTVYARFGFAALFRAAATEDSPFRVFPSRESERLSTLACSLVVIDLACQRSPLAITRRFPRRREMVVSRSIFPRQHPGSFQPTRRDPRNAPRRNRPSRPLENACATDPPYSEASPTSKPRSSRESVRTDPNRERRTARDPFLRKEKPMADPLLGFRPSRDFPRRTSSPRARLGRPRSLPRREDLAPASSGLQVTEGSRSRSHAIRRQTSDPLQTGLDHLSVIALPPRP